MTCGIYAIVCNKTWRSYVGYAVNIENRISGHFQTLRRHKHENPALQADFDLYGQSCLNWEILEECPELELGKYEAKWIEFGENLYNKNNPNTKITLSTEEEKRFWNWVKIGRPDECWNWLGAKDKDGYGRMGFRRDNKKRMFRANRIAFFLLNPNSDEHLIVRHSCHNKTCCNPNHLVVGSSRDNAKDRCDNPANHYKLNWKIVGELREKFSQNTKIKRYELKKWFVDKYKISLPTNYLIQICLNNNWVDSDYIVPNDCVLRYSPTEDDFKLISGYLFNNINIRKILTELHNFGIMISKTNLFRCIRKIKSRSSHGKLYI